VIARCREVAGEGTAGVHCVDVLIQTRIALEKGD